MKYESIELGSSWTHTNGNQYMVYDKINLLDTDKYPLTIVYQNMDNKEMYCRPASDWHGSMTLLSDAQGEFLNTPYKDNFKINELTWLEHRKWSDRNFGTGGPVGSLKHLSLEALEAAADPEDIIEYADCMFLLMDSLHRGGFTWDDLNEAMVHKLKILEARTYKKTAAGMPSLHEK